VRQVIWATLRKLKDQGMTILLTTHYMEEAAQLADTVGILDQGRLIAEDSPRELIRQTLPAYVLEFDEREVPGGPSLDGGASVERHGDRVYVFHDDERQLRGWIDDLGLRAAQLRPTSLEDVFLQLTGRGLHE
jgi:lipooligosaccharide transport system ATP-binding protein